MGKKVFESIQYVKSDLATFEGRMKERFVKRKEENKRSSKIEKSLEQLAGEVKQTALRLLYAQREKDSEISTTEKRLAKVTEFAVMAKKFDFHD